MQAASSTAKRFHRSTAEQIEYWADMGRLTAEVIDPVQVFLALEEERRDGSLMNKVITSQVKYQVCESYPGYLERIESTGKVTIGTFKEGVFSPEQETDG